MKLWRGRVTSTVRLDPHDYQRLRELAFKNDRSLTAEMRRAIREYLDAHSKEPA